MPASGARTTRFGMVRPPRVQGSRSARMTPSLGLVPLPDELEPVEGEQVVDLADRVAERHDRARQPAGGERVRLLPQLGTQAREDAVDHARVAVDGAGADGVDRRLA